MDAGGRAAMRGMRMEIGAEEAGTETKFDRPQGSFFNGELRVEFRPDYRVFRRMWAARTEKIEFSCAEIRSDGSWSGVFPG